MANEIKLNISRDFEDFCNLESFTDEFTDFLFTIGAVSISYEFSNLDTEVPTELQNHNNSKLYFNVNIPDFLNQEKFMLKVLSNYDVTFTSFTQIPNVNWVLFSQSTYKPICILNKIWIGASWHKIPKDIDRKLIKIFIDPGQAFGTGTHPTTRFCLEALIKYSNDSENKRLLDLGCGSGILSIAACKLGFPSVTAVDNDLLALTIAKKNTILNNIRENKCLFFSNLTACEGKFDLIVSNILFSTLLQLSSTIVKKLKKDGSLVLSGILKSQAHLIKKKYLDVSKNTILLKEISSESNWVCLAYFGNNQSGD